MRDLNQPRRAVASALCGALIGLGAACSVYDPKLSSDVLSQEGGGASGRGTGGTGGAAADCDALSAKPTCRREHADATCVSGKCLIASCVAPWVDCDQQDDNGCEAQLDTPQHCGLCGAACRFNHAAGNCKDGRCSLGACDAGF